MKTTTYLMSITMLSVCFAAADEKAREKEEWMRQALAKERSRAQESVEHHANTKRFEERYGWAREKHPEHFAAMMAANKKASDSWTAVLRKGESANNLDVLADVKQAANAAAADAYLSEMTLKYAASATDRKNMVEKSRDRDVGAVAAKLDANEKSLLLANRAKNEAQTAIEKLQNENRVLNQELRTAYDKARDKDKGKDRGKERDKDRDKDRKKEEDRPKNPEGGGVLGR